MAGTEVGDAAADKSAKVHPNVRRALVFNADDRRVSALASAAHTAEGCRRIGFTLGVPHPGQIGVDDGWIVDRSGVAGGAFGDEHPPGAGPGVPPPV